MEHIFSKVRAVVANILRVNEEQITLETNFKKDLGADSISLIEIAMALESEFGIVLQDEDVTAINTVDDAVKRVANYL
ncbi:MAG: acyl carrier protein [bacterium]|nr:acyl carrier protein [bacterium]